MLKTDTECHKLLFCQPNKDIEAYYPGYTQEINEFIRLAKPYVQIEVLPMWDIWMRDFMSMPTDGEPLLFTYLPDYQTENESKKSQEYVCKKYPQLKPNPIKLDGGHLVFNSKGVGFLTDYVVRLNQMPKAELEQKIKQATGLKKIIWLPWNKGDITGHTDGLLQFLTDDLLLINDDSDFEMHKQIIQKKCPDIEIIPIPCRYDTRKRKNFPSCCGIYTNFVQVQGAVFTPAYNIDLDDVVLKLFQSLTNKPVIPIRIEQTAINGGSLHCLTRNM